jgi:preprotein translocase subunit SecF
MRIFTNTNYNFLRWRWAAIAISSLIILAGIALAARLGGLRMGVDFSGGTSIIAKFQQPVSEEQVRRAIEGLPGEEAVQQFGDPSDHEMLIRLPMMASEERGTNLEEGARRVEEALKRANVGPFEVISTEIVGPVVGRDLQRKGIYATLFSILAIAVYIAVRFRPSFAIGSVIATLHDVLVTLALLVIFGYELSLNIVAAMLTMVGYSVNDMIVIFDRVRENLRSHRREPLDAVINQSLNQTLTRTVITSGTVFLSVLALYLFGGNVLQGFAFTMLAGTLATTYSGWFIAPSIAILLSKRGAEVARTPVQAGASAAPAPRAGSSPSTPPRETRSTSRRSRRRA